MRIRSARSLHDVRNVAAWVTAALLMGLSTGTAAAQYIRGTVTDGSGEGIPGANVVVDGTATGTAADARGTFLLGPLPEGVIVLTASAVGYHSARHTVRVRADTARVRMVLEEQVFESDEVVVVASRREQPSHRIPVSVATLSAEQMARRNVQVLDDALRGVSGVHVQGNQVTIRGSSGFAYNTGSRVLVMLDGMPLLAPDTDGIPLEALPMSEIERIEVLKGPGSALYGGGALGGVVNIVTRSLPDRPETRISAWSGIWEPVREPVWRDAWDGASRPRPFAGASVSHARRTSGAFGYWISGSFRRDLGYLRDTARTSVHVYGKTLWQPSPSTKLDVLSGIMVRERDNFLFWASGRDVLRPGRIALPDADTSTPNGATDDFINQFTLLPSWTHFLGSRLYYEVRGRLYGALIRPIDSQGRYMPLADGSVGYRYGSEGQVHAFPDARTRLTAGVSFDALSNRNSFFVTTDGTESGSQPEGAVFVHAERELPGGLEWVAGLRHDRYRIDRNRTEAQTSPKLAVAWTPDPRLSFRLAWGAGFRIPSFAERYTDNQEFFPIVRNLDLLPERSRSTEAGVRLRNALARLDASVFSTTYDDLVEPRLVPALQAFQFINVSRAEIFGTEITLEVRDQAWQAEAGYTWLDTEDAVSGEPLPFRARHLLHASGTLQPLRRLSLGVAYRYVSRPDRVDTDFARFVTDADLMVATHLLDVNVGWSGRAWRITLNTDNALAYAYVERPAYFGVPRHWSLRLDWTF